MGRISSVGWTTFESDLKKLGGMKRLAKTPYMRNLWLLMKTFNTLPTNKDFLALSDDQINMMIYSLQEDGREMELARKGISVDAEYYDADFDEEVWNKPVGEWEVLREGHDADEIARQVAELTRDEDLRNLASRFDGVDEYSKFVEESGKTARQSEVEQYIDRQFAEALEKAHKISAAGKGAMVDDQDLVGAPNNPTPSESSVDLDKDAIDRSIAMFNSIDDDDDDDFAHL
ncbi:hypothetical protein Goe27_00820 [Bacillus phage vB_BsuM-Goe27]|nr:hypothetical protein Goe27_00820 [Bacillus phage vB_BsuM-Goe27]